MGNIALLEGPSRPTCFVTLNSFTIILDYALVMHVAVVYGVWFTLFCVFCSDVLDLFVRYFQQGIFFST